MDNKTLDGLLVSVIVESKIMVKCLKDKKDPLERARILRETIYGALSREDEEENLIVNNKLPYGLLNKVASGVSEKTGIPIDVSRYKE